MYHYNGLAKCFGKEDNRKKVAVFFFYLPMVLDYLAKKLATRLSTLFCVPPACSNF